MWSRLYSLVNYLAQKREGYLHAVLCCGKRWRKKGNYDEGRTNLFDIGSGSCKAIDEEVYFSLLGDKK